MEESKDLLRFYNTREVVAAVTSSICQAEKIG